MLGVFDASEIRLRWKGIGQQAIKNALTTLLLIVAIEEIKVPYLPPKIDPRVMHHSVRLV
ncbi:hypothetical protein ACTXT7_011293 [Hymenolepis weldensis]